MPDTESDMLGPFLKFADAVQANAERAHRPAYAEQCICSGSVEVGRDVSRADLRRIHANFLGRHRDCFIPKNSDPDAPSPAPGSAAASTTADAVTGSPEMQHHHCTTN